MKPSRRLLPASPIGATGRESDQGRFPEGGHPLRKSTGDAYSPNFIAYNQNKQSLQIYLASPQGHKDALRLLAKADVLVENFRPGV